MVLHQGPLETWARNILAWVGSLGVTLFGKHPQYGFNSLFNKFMQPWNKKHTMPQGFRNQIKFLSKKSPKTWLDYIANSFRFKKDYLSIFKSAGIKAKHWTELDNNERQHMLNYITKLRNGMLKNQPIFSKYQARLTEDILTRIGMFKLGSVLLSGVLMTAVVGIALQKMVFKFIVPLDQKFFPKPKTKFELDGIAGASHHNAVSAVNASQPVRMHA